MPIREILQLGNPLLYQVSSAVDGFGSVATAALYADLADTLIEFRRTHGFGRAIAAPQLGHLSRAVFVDMGPGGFRGPLYNPVIVWSTAAVIRLWDDCFSFPELLVWVERAAAVRVAYQDSAGRAATLEAEGDSSELLQHELDHLDGILAVQRATLPRAFTTRSEWLRRGKAPPEMQAR